MEGDFVSVWLASCTMKYEVEVWIQYETRTDLHIYYGFELTFVRDLLWTQD